MFRFARCAVLAVAASCVLSERVDVPLFSVEPAHPVTFELPAPASKTVLGSVHVLNRRIPSESGCDVEKAFVRFEFGTYSTQTVRLQYYWRSITEKVPEQLFVGLDTSTIQVTVSTLACSVELQVYANFYELTDRAFTTQTQVTVVAKDTFPSTDKVQVPLTAGQAAFITHISLSPVALVGCTNGPPAIEVQTDTYESRGQSAVVENEGGPPMVLAVNVMDAGQLGLSITFLNSTGASCRLTLDLEVQGFEVELPATPAPPTPQPSTPPRTPFPLLAHRSTAQPVPTSAGDSTLLIVMLTAGFVGAPVVGLVVLAAACWCSKNRSMSQQEPTKGTSPYDTRPV